LADRERNERIPEPCPEHLPLFLGKAADHHPEWARYVDDPLLVFVDAAEGEAHRNLLNADRVETGVPEQSPN
jgi:hypothetical protein